MLSKKNEAASRLAPTIEARSNARTDPEALQTKVCATNTIWGFVNMETLADDLEEDADVEIAAGGGFVADIDSRVFSAVIYAHLCLILYANYITLEALL
jgi:hypothetical protein